MKPSAKGIFSELKAITWFLEQDYEVFHNLKPNGPADLVIWKEGMLAPILVDVKTLYTYKKADGTMTLLFSGLGNKGFESAQKKTKEGIYYLGYNEQDDSFLWFNEAPI